MLRTQQGSGIWYREGKCNNIQLRFLSFLRKREITYVWASSWVRTKALPRPMSLERAAPKTSLQVDPKLAIPEGWNDAFFRSLYDNSTLFSITSWRNEMWKGKLSLNNHWYEYVLLWRSVQFLLRKTFRSGRYIVNQRCNRHDSLLYVLITVRHRRITRDYLESCNAQIENITNWLFMSISL